MLVPVIHPLCSLLDVIKPKHAKGFMFVSQLICPPLNRSDQCRQPGQLRFEAPVQSERPGVEGFRYSHPRWFFWLTSDPILSDTFLTAKEAAKILRLHPVTLLQWAREGRGAYRRLSSRKIVFSRAQIVTWLESGYTRSTVRAA